MHFARGPLHTAYTRHHTMPHLWRSSSTHSRCAQLRESALDCRNASVSTCRECSDGAVSVGWWTNSLWREDAARLCRQWLGWWRYGDSPSRFATTYSDFHLQRVTCDGKHSYIRQTFPSNSYVVRHTYMLLCVGSTLARTFRAAHTHPYIREREPCYGLVVNAENLVSVLHTCLCMHVMSHARRRVNQTVAGSATR
jgi:hypothetical protein